MNDMERMAEEIMSAHYNEDGLRMDKTESRIAKALQEARGEVCPLCNVRLKVIPRFIEQRNEIVLNGCDRCKRINNKITAHL